MKQALLVISGAAIGLLASLATLASCRTDVLPRAEAQAASPEGSQASGNMIMGIGGAATNQNDLCWVLIKDKGHTRQGDYERYSLSLYKANNQGVFDLTDMREITFDGKLVQLNHPSHNKDLAPKELKKKIEEQQQAQQAQPPQAPQQTPQRPKSDN